MLQEFDDQYTEIGQIVRSHGLDGVVIVAPTVPEPDLLQNVELLQLEQPGGSRRPVRIESFRLEEKAQRLTFFVKFETIEDRTAAENLRNCRLYARDSQIADVLDEHETVELTDFTVVNEDGDEIGYIASILDSPAHPILEIATGEQVILVPYVDAFVVEINEDKEQLVLTDYEQFFDV